MNKVLWAVIAMALALLPYAAFADAYWEGGSFAR